MSGLPTHKEDFAGYSHLALFCLFSISLFTLTTQKVLSFLASVDVIFSGETCADAWIEKEARKMISLPPKPVQIDGFTRIIVDVSSFLILIGGCIERRWMPQGLGCNI
jgi:hypothetical protein